MTGNKYHSFNWPAQFSNFGCPHSTAFLLKYLAYQEFGWHKRISFKRRYVLFFLLPMTEWGYRVANYAGGETLWIARAYGKTLPP